MIWSVIMLLTAHFCKDWLQPPLARGQCYRIPMKYYVSKVNTDVGVLNGAFTTLNDGVECDRLCLTSFLTTLELPLLLLVDWFT